MNRQDYQQTTRAEELLAKIQMGGTVEIDSMIATPVTEELFLDYKQCATVGGAGLHADDHKNFGKAISGFGNSDGGLIIWGVKCRQGPNGDVPTSPPAYVYDAVAFKSLLDGAIGGRTIPPHRRVENFAYPVTSSPHGFVVTHVPPGHDVPFWSIDEKARGYYLRAGSSFERVSPGILAAMFGRRPNPQLALVVRPTFKFAAGARVANLTFQITAQNRGRGVGEIAYLGVDADDGGGLRYQESFSEQWKQLPSAADRWLLYTEQLRFPPSSEIILMSVTASIEPPVENHLKIKLHLGVVRGSGDETEIDLYAETMKSIHENLVTPTTSELQPTVRDVLYGKMDEDQKSRQRQPYLTIP
jgi:hypothetical protein